MAVLIIAFFLVKDFTFLLHFLPENLIAVRVRKVGRGGRSYLGRAWPELLTLYPLPNLNKAYY